MNSNQLDRPTKRLARKHFFASTSFQLLGGLLFAVLLPAIIQHQNQLIHNVYNIGAIYKTNEIYTLLGAAWSILVGFTIMHRLSNYPGVTTGSYILISYSMTYIITVGIFFMLRLDYSRFLFANSYLFCILWFVGVHIMERRLVRLRLAIIPGGNTTELPKIEHVKWTHLESPEAYDPSNGAIVADLRQDHPPHWERFITDCALQGIPVYHTKQVQESLTGKVAIEHLSENSFGSLLPGIVYLRFKQFIELALAFILLPAFLIILLVVGSVILVSSGRPIFFKQERVGHRGQRFYVYKFRTMTASNCNITALGKEGELDVNLRNFAITRDDDKRITRFGVFLRKFRIDEIPQIINILKGEMGWIGPRPEAVSLSEWYERELPFYRYRHIIKPGISGWAQVNQGHVSETDKVLEKLHYDFFYIKNLSAWLDLLIVLKTFRTIFTGFGSK